MSRRQEKAKCSAGCYRLGCRRPLRHVEMPIARAVKIHEKVKVDRQL
jgi:hypothetical protein